MPPRSPAKRAGAARKQAKRQAKAEARKQAAPTGREAIEARSALFEELREHTPLVGVETAEGTFVVATSDLHIGRGLFAKSRRPEIGVLQRAVAALTGLAGRETVDDRVFVDVGANIGTTTIPALLTHGFGSAVAFEPEEQNYRMLRANLSLNGLEDRAETLRVALSNRRGRSELVLIEGSGGNSWLAVDPGKVEEAVAGRADKAKEMGVELSEIPQLTTVDVELTTVDLLVEDGVIDPDRVGMLWIDAEGHEGHVLEGAGTLTERGVPTVFEFDPAGLDARGDRGKIDDVAGDRYTHFVDVRRPESQRGRPALRLQPVDELTGYADRFLSASAENSHTDLLMLRLTAEQAEVGAKLTKLVSRRQRQAQRSSGPKARRRAS